MPEPLQITIPVLPPTVNHYMNHGSHKRTPRSNKFLDDFAVFAKGKVFTAEYYSIDLIFRIHHLFKVDVDNLSKLVLDGLTTCGVIRDDRYVLKLNLTKIPAMNVRDERIVIIINEAWYQPITTPMALSRGN